MRFFVSLLLLTASLSGAGPLHFRIQLDPVLSAKLVSGRLFVFMSDSPTHKDRLSTGFRPGSSWIAAMEVTSLAPNDVFEFDPDIEAFPKPFSHAKPGDYQFMALLDPDHSYALHQQDGGDLFSEVIAVKALNPAQAEPIALKLTKRTERSPEPEDTERVKRVEFVSPFLSAFWGRPIAMRAGVVLPPKYAQREERSYPAVYDIHAFSDSYLTAWNYRGKSEDFIRVYLDGDFPTGHHEFADSVNSGPWSRALIEEFIPYLEKRFRLIAKPQARFLTGHSSGGWSSLWLQITHPDFFGGTWSTSPDPVDLRSFTGIDARPGSTQNAYRTHDGKPLNLIRQDGKDLTTMEDFAKQEAVQGEYGGQFSSFEWVWSPRGPDGRPMRLFNRKTGEQDPAVQRAWQKFDIRVILENNWATLGSKLQGKLHIIVGEQDTFHLEEAVRYLCDFLKSKGRENVCEIVPERDHMNLYRKYKTYPDGLGKRIEEEMGAAFRKSSQLN